MLEILADEEIGIAEARAEDVFVAMPDDIEILVVAVADGDEIGEEGRRMRRPDMLKGEITLVFLHHRDQHIARQGQKFRVETSQHGGRLLDQVGDLVQQIIGDDGFAV